MGTIGTLPPVRTARPGPESPRWMERERWALAHGAHGEGPFVRVPPPLTIEEGPLDRGLDIPEDAISSVSRSRQ